MKKTEDCFYPGDRVRIREDTGKLDPERPDQTFLVGTKGSIGVIVSHDEFRAYFERQLQQHRISKTEGHKKFILGVKESMEKHFRYPVKFEVVEPSVDKEALVCCRVGEIELIYVSCPTLTGDVLILEKIT
jgi:hypothetical protein